MRIRRRAAPFPLLTELRMLICGRFLLRSLDLLFTIHSNLAYAHSAPRGAFPAPYGAKNAYMRAVPASQFSFKTYHRCLRVNTKHLWYVLKQLWIVTFINIYFLLKVVKYKYNTKICLNVSHHTFITYTSQKHQICITFSSKTTNILVCIANEKCK